MEELFNLMVRRDLNRLNDMVEKGWYGTTDFNEAVMSLSDSLSAFSMEVGNENCEKGECLQKTELAKGA